MLKVKNRQTTKREFGRTHVTQIIEKFGTAQFGTKIKNGQFGTKTIWNQKLKNRQFGTRQFGTIYRACFANNLK